LAFALFHRLPIAAARPEPPFSEPKPGVACREEIALMYDIIVAAMQTDSTRVLTYRQPVTTLLTSLGLKTEAHMMSHYHGRPGDVVESFGDSNGTLDAIAA
jgi:hypothetical protein